MDWRLIEYSTERPDGVDVRLRRREASPHRIHRHMGRTQGAPDLDPAVPLVLMESLDADPRINAEPCTVAAGLFKIAMELLNVRFHTVIRRPPSRHPAVTEPRGAFEHGLCSTSKPDGDGTLNG